MNTRIRYKAYFENIIGTRQNYILSTGQVVFGTIEFDENQPCGAFFIATILELDRDQEHWKNQFTTMTEAKNHVKEALKVLGVEFAVEMRAKKADKQLQQLLENPELKEVLPDMYLKGD